MAYDECVKRSGGRPTTIGSGSKHCDRYFEILDVIFSGLSAIENKLSAVLGVYKAPERSPNIPGPDIPMEQVANKLKEVEERISTIRERLDETL